MQSGQSAQFGKRADVHDPIRVETQVLQRREACEWRDVVDGVVSQAQVRELGECDQRRQVDDLVAAEAKLPECWQVREYGYVADPVVVVQVQGTESD